MDKVKIYTFYYNGVIVFSTRTTSLQFAIGLVNGLDIKYDGYKISGGKE